MKLKLEEHIKHRIIGMIVIASIAILFLPALMKESNYRFDKKLHVAIKMPDKPDTPKIEIPDKREMFKAIEITTVKIPHVKEQPVLAEVDAQPLTDKEQQVALVKSINDSLQASHLPSIEELSKTTPKIASKSQSNSKPKSVSKPKPVSKPKSVSKPQPKSQSKSNLKSRYTVQLASFSKEGSARILVKKLRAQGYFASYGKYYGKNGEVFTVMVRRLNKEDAQLVRNQLAVSMHLNGLIIKTG